MKRKLVKVDYSVFTVRAIRVPGEYKYLVINQATNAVQSAWNSIIDARQTARRLNHLLNHRSIV